MGMKSGGAIAKFLGSSSKDNGMFKLGQILKSSNMYLKAIERNTRNLSNSSSSSPSQQVTSNNISVMAPLPDQDSPPSAFGNNRMGYADSVYSF
jgi:hypothetical protein